MARDRSDLRWQHFSGKDQAWQRLTWARETHGKFPNKAAFAKHVGESEPAYRQYERSREKGTNSAKLDFEKAVKWAAALDVRWQWLLEADGTPWLEEDDAQLSAEARDLAKEIDRFPEEERREKVQAIKALLTGTRG